MRSRTSSRSGRQGDVVVDWARLAIGFVIACLGTAVFLGVPLPTTPSPCTTYGFAQLAISAGGMAALVGAGVVISAFPGR
jgi:hypothetical protein